MPTFNKDKDSLTADINGTLAGLDKDVDTTADDYSDYVKYTYDETDANTSKVTDIEVYDAAGDGLDKIRNAGLDIETIKAAVKDPMTGSFNVTPGASSIVINGTSYEVTKMEPDAAAGGGALTASDITAIYVDLDPTTTGATPQADIVLRLAEHTAKKTLETLEALDMTDTPGIISMDEWTTTYGSQRGHYWVYDSEGWLYWAAPIEPDTATGCLLNGISINDSSLLNEEYYYGLNVVAEFATAGDWGNQVEATGFYERGLTPEGKKLLDIISSDSGITYEIEMTPDEISSGLMQSSTATFEAAVYELAGGERTRLTDVTADAFTWEVLTVSDAARTAENAATTSRIEASSAEAGKATLRIGADEQNTELIVRVTYEDPSSHKTAEKEVRVSNIEKTTIEISDFTIEGTFVADGENAFKVYPNSTIVFTATATKTDGTGTTDVTDQLQWSLDGERTDSDTSLNESSRTLVIGENERSKELIVTAAYNDTVNSMIYTKSYRITEILTVEYEVSIDSGVSEIEDGDTQSYTASVSCISGPEAGTKKTDAQIDWSVVDASTSKVLKSGTRIDQNGNLSVAVGETASQLKIIASYGGVSTSKTVTVNRISYSIEVTPDLTSSSLMQNATREFTATVYKHQGDTKTALTDVSAGEMEWSVNQGRGVTLSSDTTMTKASSNPLKASLHVGYDEQNTSIHILASYTSPLNKKAETTQQISIEKSSVEIMLTIVGGEHVNVSDGVIKAYPGKTIAFRATAKRIDGAETTDVTNQLQWSLEGNNTDSNTNLNTGSALLSIGASERSKDLAVTVTYADSVNYKVYTKSYRIAEILTTQYGVSIDSGVSTIENGETQSYTASVFCLNGSAAGTKKTDAKVSWSVVDVSTSKAPVSGTTIDQNGNLSVAAGETASQLKITASYGGASASKTITVNATYSIKVTPDLTTDGLVQNATQELTATIYKQQGSTKTEVTSIGANDLTWEFVDTPTSGTSLTKLSTNNRKASLHVAENETKDSLSIRVTYTDALNRTGEKTIQITIQETLYELMVGEVTDSLVQEESISLPSVTLRKVNGPNVGETVSVNSSQVTWEVIGAENKTETKISDGNLIIAENEAANKVQLKATYTSKNITYVEKSAEIKIVPTEFTVGVEQTAYRLGIVTFKAIVKKSNGPNVGQEQVLDAQNIKWTMSGETGGAGTTYQSECSNKKSIATVTIGGTEKSKVIKMEAAYTSPVNGATASGSADVGAIAEYAMSIQNNDTSALKAGATIDLTAVITQSIDGVEETITGELDVGWEILTESSTSKVTSNYQTGTLKLSREEPNTDIDVKAVFTTDNGIVLESSYALNGIKAITTAEKNVLTKVQAAIDAGKVGKIGSALKIDDSEYYVVHYDEATKYALLWSAQVVTDKYMKFGAYANGFWRDSNPRMYLQGTGENQFLGLNSTIKEMVDSEIIPMVHLGTRSYAEDDRVIYTDDTIFLLSSADIDGSGGNAGTVAVEEEYTTYAVTGVGEKLSIGTKVLTCDSSTDSDTGKVIGYSLLRSARSSNECAVARLKNKDGSIAQAYIDDNCSSGSNQYYGIRPAFWIALEE